jgi:hypothetical protein
MYIPGEEALEDGELRVTVLGKQRAPFTPAMPAPPAWWAEALIPLD